LPRKTKAHFCFRVDIWDDTGDSIIEHVAGVDDFEVAEATYRAAVARWPTARLRSQVGASFGARTFIVILRLFAQESYGRSLCWLWGQRAKILFKING
jgi:hypothetical protein